MPREITFVAEYALFGSERPLMLCIQLGRELRATLLTFSGRMD
jgi:hypothetical protein